MKKEKVEKVEKVEILCIVDTSASMSRIMTDVVSELNKFIDDQKALPGKAKLTLAAFDNEYRVIMDRVKLKDVEPITFSQLQPSGMTALLDAIGTTLSNAKKNRKTICLIQTDGHENVSKEYTNESVSKLIKEKEAEGWEFVFIGAGVDAFTVGSTFGLAQAQCFSVDRSAKGAQDMGEVYTATTSLYRQ